MGAGCQARRGWGSSPLTRGKLPGGLVGLAVRGLIPAHAGKTTPAARPPPSRRAHPRSRGENAARSWMSRHLPGSSPLTRGKPSEALAGCGGDGLIPAHAGKTVCVRLRSLMLSGSSPLTRGKRARRAPPHVGGRLIPAHAGKTSWTSPTSSRPWAHPRSRGENLRAVHLNPREQGSSPLTRGKLPLDERPFLGVGLIPAHAGKTRTRSARAPSNRAHPRSRGENREAGDKHIGPSGSSPLTRGKHFLTCAFTAQIGQILESLELCASSESYSSPDAYATDAP